jgi:hypothetical protein
MQFLFIFAQVKAKKAEKSKSKQKRTVGTLIDGMGLPGLLAMIAPAMLRILALPFPLQTKSKQGLWT